MSRIGRMAITIPAGVTVNVAPDNTVTVNGPLGTLTEKLSDKIGINIEGNVVHVTRDSEENDIKALHGLTRTLLEQYGRGRFRRFQESA